jgi:hypothetical protein
MVRMLDSGHGLRSGNKKPAMRVFAAADAVFKLLNILQHRERAMTYSRVLLRVFRNETTSNLGINS